MGEDVGEARRRGVVDLVIGEPKNMPTTLLKIGGLPSVLGSDLGAIVPVDAITEDDQRPFVNDEINNPSVAHGNLLTEGDASILEQSRHTDLKAGPLLRDAVVVDITTVARTEVCLASFDRVDAAGELGELFAAVGADARHPLFIAGILITTEPSFMELRSARVRTETPPPFSRRFPLGGEHHSTDAAGLFDKSGDLGVNALCGPLAGAATEACSTFDRPRRDFVGRCAILAGDDAGHDTYILPRPQTLTNSHNGLVSSLGGLT